MSRTDYHHFCARHRAQRPSRRVRVSASRHLGAVAALLWVRVWAAIDARGALWGAA